MAADQGQMAGLTKLRAGLEVLTVLVLIQVGAAAGAIAGALTGVVILGPIGAVVLPLAAATLFLRRQGHSWISLGFFTPLKPVSLVAWVTGTLVSAYFILAVIVVPALEAMEVPPLNIGLLVGLIEGNTLNYLLFLVPVAWGSAAIGEEMLMRGFLLHRISNMSNDYVAVPVQAALFAFAHFYQGWMGVITIFVLAIIFGVVFIRCGRTLWPVIIAHGLIDTVSMTLIYTGKSQYLLGAG